MTILNIALAVILFIGILSQYSLKSMFERIGKNIADIFLNRDKEYESEKGRNLATKEDIEEITSKIEQVKSEVTFFNKRKQDHIIDREERLLKLLYLSNKLSIIYNRIYLQGRNDYNYEKMFSIIEEINSIMIELTYVRQLILVDKGVEDQSSIETLYKLADSYSIELSTIANNAGNCLHGSALIKKRALENNTSYSGELQIAKKLLDQATSYIEEEPEIRSKFKKAISKYVLWLQNIYGVEGISNASVCSDVYPPKKLYDY